VDGDASPLQMKGVHISEEDPINEDEEVFTAEPGEIISAGSLLNELPAAKEKLEWVPVTRLHELPLTGLARKVLQRLRVMPMQRVQTKIG